MVSETSAPLSPVTGKPMVRDVRPLVVTFGKKTATVDMPGWYGDGNSDSIHTAEDMKVSDAALAELRKQTFDESRARLREFAKEPKTEKLLCSGCGCDMPRLYSKRTRRVWCMDCSMMALLDE